MWPVFWSAIALIVLGFLLGVTVPNLYSPWIIGIGFTIIASQGVYYAATS